MQHSISFSAMISFVQVWW